MKTLKTENEKKDEQLAASAASYAKLMNQKKSSEINLGKISEQLAPFLDTFGYDPQDLHFIGQPIDYICFLDDKIVFIEVKSGKSKLTSKQKNIKSLIENGQVFWDEFRVSGHSDD